MEEKKEDVISHLEENYGIPTKIRLDFAKLIPEHKDIAGFYGGYNTYHDMRVKGTLVYIKDSKDYDVPKVMELNCNPWMHHLVVDNFIAIFQDTLSHYGEKKMKELNLNIIDGLRTSTYEVKSRRNDPEPVDEKYLAGHYGVEVNMSEDTNNRVLRKNGEYKDAPQFSKPEYEAFWSIVEKYGGVSIGRELNFEWGLFQFVKISPERISLWTENRIRTMKTLGIDQLNELKEYYTKYIATLPRKTHEKLYTAYAEHLQRTEDALADKT